jgi:beta-lactam-binding protein with PASTA domain
MKITTIENYIKYTDIPYTEIIKRAKRGGLNVNIGETVKISDEFNRVIRMFPDNKNDIDAGMLFIRYNYSN